MKWVQHFLQASGVLPLVVALCLSGCDRFPAALKNPKNITTLSPRLNQLFEKTKTVCFCHFVVEVPASATVVYGPAWVNAPIAFFPGDAQKVAQHVAESLVEVEKHRDYLRVGTELLSNDSIFGKVTDGAVPGQKLVFGSLDHVTYSIYSIIPVGDDLFVQHAKSAVRKNEEINKLNTVAQNLHQRAPDEVPTGAGTCIDGGLVTWQPEFEKVTVGIRLKEFPDVHFSIEVLKNQAHLPELSDLETRLRLAESDGGNWYSRVTFFRRGPRQISDWKGLEALALRPAQENVKEAHEFHFISLGAPNAPLQPELNIQLDTGASGDHMGAVTPSLSNEEAVALWDKLTGSIRVRALGGTASTVESPNKPSTDLIATGGTCSQTGWWQCVEGDGIEGGRRRHFVAGDAMPPAILLGNLSLWQKLTGNRSRHTRATVWRLVGNEAEPAATSPIAGDTTSQTSFPAAPGAASKPDTGT